MPTGYTDKITRGATFEEFVLGCAKAFIAMREDDSDATIPDKFEPSTHNTDALAKAEQRLFVLRNMSLEAANIAANADYSLEEVRVRESIEKTRRTIAAYKDMLYKVVQWEPPTPEHVEMKDFMIEQIKSSIKFDDAETYHLERPVKRLSGEEWLAKAIAETKYSIDYHTEQNQKEIERVAARNKWVQDLRDSLKR